MARIKLGGGRGVRGPQIVLAVGVMNVVGVLLNLVRHHVSGDSAADRLVVFLLTVVVAVDVVALLAVVMMIWRRNQTGR